MPIPVIVQIIIGFAIISTVAAIEIAIITAEPEVREESIELDFAPVDVPTVEAVLNSDTLLDANEQVSVGMDGKPIKKQPPKGDTDVTPEKEDPNAPEIPTVDGPAKDKGPIKVIKRHPGGDPDLDRKAGGEDPIVLSPWGYNDFDAYKCSNAPNSFDYDNDGYPEHMCYWYTPETRILFNDIYNNQTLVNGYNFMGEFTHIWTDKNSNVYVDDGELIPYDGGIIHQTFSYEPKGMKLWENGRYVYCLLSLENYEENAYCTKPTYWQTQEWMKGIK